MHAVLQLQGRREYQEDRYLIVPNFYMGYSLFAVFDGHGGSYAAEFCRENMAAMLEANMQKQRGLNMRIALHETFQGLSRAMARGQSFICGTTCILVLKHDNHIWVANCGDSRAIMGTRTTYAVLSRDHKPGDVSEASRIHASGGFVSNVMGVPRVLGELAVSRSLGDARYFPYVTPTPDIVYVPLSAEHKYILLASDGLWDEMTNGEVAHHVTKHISPTPTHVNLPSAVNNLSAEISKKRAPEDNITILLVGM